MIKIDNLSVNYKAVKALDNVSIEFSDSKIYALFGTMGSGKSTLLEICAELIDPQSGTIVNDYSKNTRSYCSKEIALYQDLKVIDNIKFWCGVNNIKYNTITSKLAKYELDELLDKKVNSLSSGNMQKVNLFCSLLNEKGLFIFDEVLISLDKQTKTRFKEDIISKQSDSLFLIASHLFNDVFDLCTDVVVLQEGKIKINKAVDQLTNEDISYLKDEFSTKDVI